MRLQAKAKDLLQSWRGQGYSFGPGSLDATGAHAAALGRTALVVANSGRWLRTSVETVLDSLQREGVKSAGGDGRPATVPGAAPNAPRQDVLRIAQEIADRQPEVVVALGGGSTIDAVKAAAALAALGRNSAAPAPEALLDRLFGTGQVTAALAAADGVRLPAIVAVQTAASSAAHLTKYSNVTDPNVGQKKLIVDDALVPPAAVFDYSLITTAPTSLLLDGAHDGLAHCLEVLWGAPAHGESTDRITEVALCGIELVVKYLPAAVDASEDGKTEACIALGLATDLGGYAIMLGGTNGPHLNSFSLVEVASHGQACAILQPYWTVFFAPAIEQRLRLVGEILHRHGYLPTAPEGLDGRALGLSVARAMQAMSRPLGYPLALGELPGWDDRMTDRALDAARDPQLEMKLRNMPLPLDAASVDRYMRPLLRAAAAGDLSAVPEYGGQGGS